jgi:hypothetical protein
MPHPNNYAQKRCPCCGSLLSPMNPLFGAYQNFSLSQAATQRSLAAARASFAQLELAAAPIRAEMRRLEAKAEELNLNFSF